MIGWLLEPWNAPLVAKGGLAALIVGVPAAAIGCWVILRDLPYAAESLAHGMFPGLVLATLIGLPVALGGIAGLAAAAAAIALARAARIESDAAVAVAVTPLLGLGAALALSGSAPPGAEAALFGDVLSVRTGDVALALAFAAVASIALRLGHWQLVASGLRTGLSYRSDAIVLFLLAAATIAAARSLGALLTVSLILGPAAAARVMTRRAAPMILTAAAIAAVTILLGIELSWHAGWATGPSIAICAIIPAAMALPLARFRPATPRAAQEA
ncbi:MAG: metal ABC transporter permease [Actinomycetes bacterium]